MKTRLSRTLAKPSSRYLIVIGLAAVLGVATFAYTSAFGIPIPWLPPPPPPQSSAFSPHIIGAWWWMDPAYTDDASIQSGMQSLKQMSFTAIYPCEQSICDGNLDNSLSSTKTAKVISHAEQTSMYVIPLLWASDWPVAWSDKDPDDTNFRTWFAGHLQKLSSYFSQHSCVKGFMFDDFGVEAGKVDSMSEFVAFIKTNLNLGRDYFIEFDEVYSYNYAYRMIPAQKIMQKDTATCGYNYYITDASAWQNVWIDDMNTRFAGNYPDHRLGIVLDAFEDSSQGGGWSPSKHTAQIQKAMSYNFTTWSYYAWRRGGPPVEGGSETTSTIFYHQEWWSAIKANNDMILSYLDGLP